MERGVNKCEKGVVLSGTDKKDGEVCTDIIPKGVAQFFCCCCCCFS